MLDAQNSGSITTRLKGKAFLAVQVIDAFKAFERMSARLDF